MDKVAQLYEYYLGPEEVAVTTPAAILHLTVLVFGCPLLFGVALHFRDELKRLTCGNAYLAVYLFGSVQMLLTYFRLEAGHALGHSTVFGTLLPAAPAIVGSIVAVCGQILNFLVYYRLGLVGVYYGNAFGIDLPWCTKFPFGRHGIPHPQYFGATLSALGVALKSGTTAGYLVVAATLLCYTIVIPVEKHYFAHIDEKRKRRASSKLE